MIPFLFSIALISTDAPVDLDCDVDYGEVYLEESKTRELPLFHLSAGYASGVSNSFLNMHSIIANGQVRVWKYVSTGILGQFVHVDYSDAGDQINKLNQSGFVVHYPTPRWGVFSHSQIDFMLGKWNILNLTTIQVDLLFGGGAGLLRKRDDLNGPTRSEATYLWSVEQRLQFNDVAGLSVSGFGHGGGVFLQAGLFTSIL